MENNNLALIIKEAEGWIGRLKALQARHNVPPFPGADQGACPNHGNSHCMACMWPRGKVTISGLRDDTSTSDATPEFEQAIGYTAVDMTTAAAEGFRDDVASVTERATGEYITGSGYDGFDNGVD